VSLWWWLAWELDRWAAADQQPRLWWRDDDACDVTPALARLVALAERYQVPLVLAVVPEAGPASGLERLAGFLAGRSGIFVGQHGVRHENHRRPGEPDAEFRADESPAAIATAIAGAHPRIAGLPGSLPLYIPPWNAAHSALYAALPQAGLDLFSSNAEQAIPGISLRQAHVQVDLLRWKPVPRFRGRQRCLSRLCRVLRRRRLAGQWEQPIGLLTHHLVHDASAWAFLDAFLERTYKDDRIAWPTPLEIFAPAWLIRAHA
jgi:hypothetical protein